MKVILLIAKLMSIFLCISCKTGFMVKKKSVSYTGESISVNNVIAIEPYCLYFEVNTPFLKEKNDSLNFQEKKQEFNRLFYNCISKQKIKYKTDSSIFSKSAIYLRKYSPQLQGILDSLKKNIVMPNDSNIYMVNVLLFIRSLNEGTVTVPSPYLESLIQSYFIVFKNSNVIHSRVYYHRVNDGFPPNKDVKPYFQEAQMRDVIEKSMKDFMKHVKRE
jgi:hypothetical protein